ncbi:MAG: thioredoxin [Candidatus Micrarchaeota archaeon]|nr:thioredoxin [Candidatus Micrarchaeota archaeon]
MAMVDHATKADFKDKIKDGLVLVDFYADWCGPCRFLSPILEEIEKEKSVKGLKIVKVNVDEETDLAEEYSVMSIPTLYLFLNGKEVGKQIGALPKERLLAWLRNFSK